jgi:predicted RNA-binding Zn ribbon-like protein
MGATEAEPQLRTGSPPAPGNLILLEGFLNTWSGELGIEDFNTASSTEAWMRDVGLWTGAPKVTSKQHQEILKFRDALRTWILDEKGFQPLNDLVKEISFQAEFGPEGDVQFRPTGNTYQGVLGTLTEVISESQQDGTWGRFRCCELTTCGWAFYDSTRSRTKRWCSMKTCGSRHKAREYYKRKR